MDGKDAFVVADRKLRRGRCASAILLIGMGFASIALFVAGLFPGYLLEHDAGRLRDASVRCPERIPSEQGYDVECVRALIARGPIYLGKEL